MVSERRHDAWRQYLYRQFPTNDEETGGGDAAAGNTKSPHPASLHHLFLGNQSFALVQVCVLDVGLQLMCACVYIDMELAVREQYHTSVILLVQAFAYVSGL